MSGEKNGPVRKSMSAQIQLLGNIIIFLPVGLDYSKNLY